MRPPTATLAGTLAAVLASGPGCSGRAPMPPPTPEPIQLVPSRCENEERASEAAFCTSEVSASIEESRYLVSAARSAGAIRARVASRSRVARPGVALELVLLDVRTGLTARRMPVPTLFFAPVRERDEVPWSDGDSRDERTALMRVRAGDEVRMFVQPHDLSPGWALAMTQGSALVPEADWDRAADAVDDLLRVDQLCRRRIVDRVDRCGTAVWAHIGLNTWLASEAEGLSVADAPDAVDDLSERAAVLEAELTEAAQRDPATLVGLLYLLMASGVRWSGGPTPASPIWGHGTSRAGDSSTFALIDRLLSDEWELPGCGTNQALSGGSSGLCAALWGLRTRACETSTLAPESNGDGQMGTVLD